MGSISAIESILARMASYDQKPAVFFRGAEQTYDQFLKSIDVARLRLDSAGIIPGSVVAVLGEFSPATCALFFALLRQRSILVPLTQVNKVEHDNFFAIAGVEFSITVDANERIDVRAIIPTKRNELVERFTAEHAPGLIVFTSGSTGKPKGVLHNCENVAKKFIAERRGWRTILFLLMDHFGGFNTFLSAFAYGGMAVCISDRTPTAVCESIDAAKATLFPTTPTFINLLISSNVYRSYDLSSVQLITYGTEVMPEATLKKVRGIFPNAQVKQTYGLSELGVLRSKSENDSSLWVRLGGDGFEVKVVDDVLWVRSEANMVGYLNAPSPFDDEGWMCTGDHVETRGDYVRIIGRKSDMINVGGQKVFPAEVEAVLLEAPNISDATVYAGTHPILGQVVLARIALQEDEAAEAVSERLRSHCIKRLQKYKIPMRFTIVSADSQRSERFKKTRRGSDELTT